MSLKLSSHSSLDELLCPTPVLSEIQKIGHLESYPPAKQSKLKKDFGASIGPDVVTLRLRL